MGEDHEPYRDTHPPGWEEESACDNLEEFANEIIEAQRAVFAKPKLKQNHLESIRAAWQKAREIAWIHVLVPVPPQPPVRNADEYLAATDILCGWIDTRYRELSPIWRKARGLDGSVPNIRQPGRKRTSEEIEKLARLLSNLGQTWKEVAEGINTVFGTTHTSESARNILQDRRKSN